jgi:hypothetical protein
MSMASTSVYSLPPTQAQTTSPTRPLQFAVNAVRDGSARHALRLLSANAHGFADNKPFGRHQCRNTITVNSATSVNLLNSKFTPSIVTAPRPMQCLHQRNDDRRNERTGQSCQAPTATTTTNTFVSDDGPLHLQLDLPAQRGYNAPMPAKKKSTAEHRHRCE